MRKTLLIILIVLFWAGLSSSGADTVLLQGAHSITYDIINPRGLKKIPEYTNQSFSQTIVEHDGISMKAVVTIRLDPIPPSGSFPIDRSTLPAEVLPFLDPEEDIPCRHSRVVSLAGEITSGASTAGDAYNRIINWVMDNLEYQIDTPQDTFSVLKKRKGSCVGFSNLSITLLRASGIPARYVSGYLPPGYDWGISKDYWGVKTSGGGFHAWIEVFLPGAGWVFTDSQHSKTFVDPFHLLLGIRGLEIGDNVPRKGEYISVDDGTSYTIAAEKNTIEPVDKLTLPKKELLGRLGARMQPRARVVATLTDDKNEIVPGSEAVLWDQKKGTVISAHESGKIYIIGLNPGTHDLTFQADGYASKKEKITLAAGEQKEVSLILKEGGELEGIVQNEEGDPLGNAKVFIWEGPMGTGYPVGKDGRFSLNHLPVGEMKVSARADNGFIEQEKRVIIKKGSPVTITFTLTQGGVIKGNITETNGKPVGKGKIFVWTGDRGIGYAIHSDGTYRINGVKPGEYKISVRSPGFIEEYQTVKVEKGQTARTDFSLEQKGF